MKINDDIVILIPAYNPTYDLVNVTNDLLKKGYKIVVVNDGSNKNRYKIFKDLDRRVVVLKHKSNKGKGVALKTGLKYIVDETNCKGVVTADADGQHIVEDIVSVADELLKKENSNKLILGSRLDKKKMPKKSKFGNSITSLTFLLSTRVKVHDTQSGLRGIPRSLIKRFIKIPGSRYEYEMGMLIYCTQNDIEIKEIPIHTVYTDKKNSTSSFKAVKDSFKIYKYLYQTTQLKIGVLYVLTSLLSAIVDFTLVLIVNHITLGMENRHIALLITVVSARIVSSLLGFLLNRVVVFHSKENLFKSLTKYYILAVFTLAASYGLLDLFTVKLKLALPPTKIFVDLFLFFAGYMIQKVVVFKYKKEKPMKSQEIEE